MVAMCEASEASKGWSDDAKGGSPGAAAQLITSLCLPTKSLHSSDSLSTLILRRPGRYTSRISYGLQRGCHSRLSLSHSPLWTNESRKSLRVINPNSTAIRWTQRKLFACSAEAIRNPARCEPTMARD
jgi:hypothetical protein